MTFFEFSIYTFILLSFIIGAFIYYDNVRKSKILNKSEGAIITIVSSLAILFVIIILNDNFGFVTFAEEEKVYVEEYHAPEKPKAKKLGKWKVSLDGNSFTIEICEKGNSYHSYIDYGEDVSSHESLDKVGDKYYVSGSSAGDYYVIDGTTLYLGDNDGIIYSATTQWIE